MRRVELVNFVKKQIENLKSYSPNEEKLLIERTLNLTKEKLLLKDFFSTKEVEKVKKVVEKRKKEKPLNKIFNLQEFYGRDFYCKNCLAPRKETEVLVESVLKENKGTKVLDVYSGCGNIGLSIKRLKRKCEVFLSDEDTNAIKCIKENIKRQNLKGVTVVKGSNFEKVEKYKPFDIITCNPPYLTKNEYKNLDKFVLFDPKKALVGGEDGLKFYRIIEKNLKTFLKDDGVCFMEIGVNQKKQIEEIFGAYKVEFKKDYSNIDRVCIIRKGK